MKHRAMSLRVIAILNFCNKKNTPAAGEQICTNLETESPHLT